MKISSAVNVFKAVSRTSAADCSKDELVAETFLVQAQGCAVCTYQRPDRSDIPPIPLVLTTCEVRRILRTIYHSQELAHVPDRIKSAMLERLKVLLQGILR